MKLMIDIKEEDLKEIKRYIGVIDKTLSDIFSILERDKDTPRALYELGQLECWIKDNKEPKNNIYKFCNSILDELYYERRKREQADKVVDKGEE